MSGKILVLEILGKKWSKRGQKGLFLNFLEKFSFVFLDIVHVDRGKYCASFGENRMSGIGGQQKSDSPDMGPRVTPKRLFRLFLENFSLDFANYLSEWGTYGT